MEWARRGAKSRAGLIAYPVLPPRDRPIDHTNAPTRTGPSPGANPPGAIRRENSAVETRIKTNVPSASLKKFQSHLGMAGEVQKHASFAPGSSVTAQCGL